MSYETVLPSVATVVLACLVASNFKNGTGFDEFIKIRFCLVVGLMNVENHSYEILPFTKLYPFSK